MMLLAVSAGTAAIAAGVLFVVGWAVVVICGVVSLWRDRDAARRRRRLRSRRLRREGMAA